jgi:hypothetical protein
MTARKKTGGRKSTKSSSSRKRTSGTSSTKTAGSTKKSTSTAKRASTKKSTSTTKRASTKRSPATPAKRKSSNPTPTGAHTDPKGRGLRGVSGKEERMYEHIKEDAQGSGRYGKRAKEVAARTVMKMHKARGHRRGQ